MKYGTLEHPHKKEQLGTQVLAIVTAKHWFCEGQLHAIYENFYVVAEWHDYHDGKKSNIEGKTTIAICKDYDDAELVYNKKYHVLF